MKRTWEIDELVEQCTLSTSELELLGNKSGQTRLGFAVLLKYFQLEGQFPSSRQDVPGAMVPFIARQVGIPADLYLQYDWESRTSMYHRAEIRDLHGFREATMQDGDALVSWLSQQILLHDLEPDHARSAAYERFRDLCIEPPTPERIERLIRSAMRTTEERFFAAVQAGLTPATRLKLDALLAASPQTTPIEPDEQNNQVPSEQTLWHDLISDPGPVSLESVLSEVAKLQCLRALDLPADQFGGVATSALQHYRKRAATDTLHELRAKRATYLFESAWKRKYSDQGVRKLLERYAQAAGLERSISPHTLHHFLFTCLKKPGIDDALIQPYSGHEHRQSLEVYSRLTIDEAQRKYTEAMKRFPV